MKKYKLIKEYPGSPKLGTEIIKSTIYGASSTKVVHTYMIKGDETFKLNNPKDYPEFWQEIVEKDYKILSYITKSNAIWKLYDSICNTWCNDINSQIFSFDCLMNNYKVQIHSIKRLSDGKIFTIGDKIFPNNKIYKFELKDNNLKIWHCDISFSTPIIEGPSGQPGNCSWVEGISNVQKIKQPLFTTEDGVDIFEGDKYYPVCNYYNLHNACIYPSGHKMYKLFSTKEKAKEYILMNKPCLSYNDILSELNLTTSEKKTLKSITQKKLNNNN